MAYQRHDENNNPVTVSPYQRHDKDNTPVASIDVYERHDINNQDVDISELIELATDVFGNIFRNYSGGYVRHGINNEVIRSIAPLFEDASLYLNFAGEKDLIDSVSGDNLITFTRASTATYVGSDGLIKTTPVNLLTHSEEFDQWTIGSSSTVTPNAATAPDGTLTADRVSNPATGSTFVGNGAVFVGTTYTASVYAKAVTPGTNDTFTFNVGGGGVNSSSEFTATAEWQRFTFTATPVSVTGAGGNRLYINNEGDGFATDVYFWGAQLEEGSTASVYAPTTSTISGAPRFDHDPATGESLGLLIEESRTNLLTHSEEFDQWANTNSTVTADVIAAPDGSITASQINRANTSSSNYIRKDTSKDGSPITYTASIYFKKDDARYASIRLQGSYPSRVDAVFDLDTGTVSSGPTVFSNFSGPSATIVPATDGWYRCSLTATSDSHTSLATLVSTSAGNNPVDGVSTDVNSVYVWGAQLEEGSFSTSYIPTSGSAITRAADVAEITGADFSSFHNASEGTYFIDAGASAGTNSEQARGFVVSNGTNNNRIGTNFKSPDSFNLFFAAANNVATTLADNIPGLPRPIKAAIAYKAGDYRGAYDGQLTLTSTVGSTPTVDQLSIGSQGYSSDGYFNGHIKLLAYFPTRKTDETLEEITAQD